MYVKLNGLNMSFEIGVSVDYFFKTSAINFIFAQCIVTVNVLTVTDDNEDLERCIFSIMSVKCTKDYLVFLILLFVCLFGVFRPTQESFTHMVMSPLPMKGCKF